MEKLKGPDALRARNAVLRCIDTTAGIYDKDTLNKVAFDVLYEELGDKPALLKRACEAYNSNKSIYKLSHATDDNRGDSFALLDAVAMGKKASDKAMVDTMKKTASAGVFVAPRYFKLEEPMKKAASAETSTIVAKPKFDTASIDVSTKNALYNRVCTLSTDCESLFNKLASDESIAESNFRKALNTFKHAMANATNGQRKEAASLICSCFGTFGRSLMERFNATAGINKVASVDVVQYKGTPRLPHNALFDAVRDVRDANALYKRASMLKEKAVRDMLAPIYDIACGHNLQKLANAGSIAAGALLNNLARNAGSALDMKDVSSSKAREKLRTPRLQNALRELEMKRVFYDIMADNYISGFPVPDVLNAFNDSVAALPVPEQGRVGIHGPLLRSWVTSRLSRGNVPSEADAERILRATEALDRLKYYEDSLHPAGGNDAKESVGA